MNHEKKNIQKYGQRRANFNLALSYQYHSNLEEVIKFYILAATRYNYTNASY
jgi:hypothetical protein